VHGVSWTRKMWMPQLEALSDEFRVIALDLPGHGALRGQSFQLKAAVQAVMESFRQQTHDRALIVGLSLGGYVAMTCAHDYPQEIAGLVLSGCCIDYRGPIGMLSWLDSSLVTFLFSEERLSRMQEKTLRSMFPEAVVKPQIEAGFSWISRTNNHYNRGKRQAKSEKGSKSAKRRPGWSASDHQTSGSYLQFGTARSIYSIGEDLCETAQYSKRLAFECIDKACSREIRESWESYLLHSQFFETSVLDQGSQIFLPSLLTSTHSRTRW